MSMNKKYEPLFTPWKIGNVEIKNRIVQCSMGGTSLFGWKSPFGEVQTQCGPCASRHAVRARYYG